jgi:hypothetical protein
MFFAARFKLLKHVFGLNEPHLPETLGTVLLKLREVDNHIFYHVKHLGYS